VKLTIARDEWKVDEGRAGFFIEARLVHFVRDIVKKSVTRLGTAGVGSIHVTIVITISDTRATLSFESFEIRHAVFA